MHIPLTPEQQARLSVYVERGDFTSVEEAAAQLIDERIAERMLEEGDSLIWAKPYVDEALAAVAIDGTISLEEHRSQIATVLAALKD